MTAPTLHVFTYHYVRDLPNTPYPRIKGLLTSKFREQLAAFRERYEMATMESAIGFLDGVYSPRRDLCLLTFDDGLKEHYAEVTPLLHENGIQGAFFPITACVEERRVAPVHMNHFLMAALDFDAYRSAVVERLASSKSSADPTAQIDPWIAKQTYRWDTPDVAVFKYLINFVLTPAVRDELLRAIFIDEIADEASFSDSLYANWEELRQMQEAGMIIGGHSHQHRPLATLSQEELEQDLFTATNLLREHIKPQPIWSFCYPYGKEHTFNAASASWLKQHGFVCSFTTEFGANDPGADLFRLRRFDCNDALKELPR